MFHIADAERGRRGDTAKTPQAFRLIEALLFQTEPYGVNRIRRVNWTVGTLLSIHQSDQYVEAISSPRALRCAP